MSLLELILTKKALIFLKLSMKYLGMISFDCIHFFLEKYIIVLKSTFSVCDGNYAKIFIQSLFQFSLFLLFICCNKMFSVSFLSVSRLYFSLQDCCLAGVTARFLLIFGLYLSLNNLLPNK